MQIDKKRHKRTIVIGRKTGRLRNVGGRKTASQTLS